MNQKCLHQTFRVFLLVIFLGFLGPSGAIGQLSDGKPMLADGFTDYFLKNVNDLAYKNVKNVNHFHLGPAMKLIKGGQPDRAIGDLKFVLRWVPNHPMGLSLMGTVSQMLGRPNLGIIYFEQAIALFPEYGLTHAQFGKFMYDIKEHKRASKYLTKAISLDSKLSVGHGWLSLVYSAEGRTDLAKKSAKKAKALGYKGPFPRGMGSP